MVSDTIVRLDKYTKTIPLADEICRFVQEQRTTIEPGQWTVLQEGLKVILLESSNYKEGVLETHQKNFDLHVTLQGCDRMHVTTTDKLVLERPYDYDNDYALWKGREEKVFDLKPFHFLFLSPTEAHNNRFLEEDTRKLVFKIRI